MCADLERISFHAWSTLRYAGCSRYEGCALRFGAGAVRQGGVGRLTRLLYRTCRPVCSCRWCRACRRRGEFHVLCDRYGMGRFRRQRWWLTSGGCLTWLMAGSVRGVPRPAVCRSPSRLCPVPPRSSPALPGYCLHQSGAVVCVWGRAVICDPADHRTTTRSPLSGSTGTRARAEPSRVEPKRHLPTRRHSDGAALGVFPPSPAPASPDRGQPVPRLRPACRDQTDYTLKFTERVGGAAVHSAEQTSGWEWSVSSCVLSVIVVFQRVYNAAFVGDWRALHATVSVVYVSTLLSAHFESGCILS